MSGVVSATTIIPDDLAVDFRDTAWRSGVKNTSVSTFAVGNVTATASNSLGLDSVLTYFYDDGLGITSTNDPGEEINGYEYLTISFSGGMWLSGVWITDLYNPDNNYEDAFGNKTAEAGSYTIYNGTGTDTNTFSGVQPFVKDANGDVIYNGELYVDFGGSTYIESIVFSIYSASGTIDENYFKNDYSVAGFTSAPVPEPATIFLLGSGLCGLTNFARKRQKKTKV